MALLLACVGIYGVTSYIVSQRNRETGIRLALGADPRRLIGLQMYRTLKVALIGRVIGVAGAVAGTRVLKSMLVGVSTTDLVTLSTAPLFLLLVAGCAAYLPARRATQVDPLNTVRHD
jgi:ABC-type antimicrobial peptide transport system permease subunit